MGHRPTHIDLNHDDLSDQPKPPRAPFYMDLPSPRTGEVPPALSPLDAFQMRSRLLARRFEEPNESGRRISRLPHNDVAKELGNRPGYYRTASNSSNASGSAMSDVPEVREESSPSNPPQQKGLVSVSEDKNRPVSHYPMFGNAGKKDYERQLSTPIEETPNEYFDAEEELEQSEPPDYFGIAVPRASSPDPVEPRAINIHAASPLDMPSLTNSVDSIQSPQPRTLTNSSTQSKRSQRSLAPPKSPAYPKSPRSFHSIRSVPDSGDEETPYGGPHAVSSARKFSESSGMSRPQSPYSPWMQPTNRSPSAMSDRSMNGVQRRNFSRPLSSAGNKQDVYPRPSLDSRSSFETRPSTDLPHRQHSVTSESTHPSSGPPSRQASQDEARTPFATALPRQLDSANGDYFDDSRPTTSYTYRKYDLPRGMNVERGSRGTRESWLHKQFTWDNEFDLEHKQQQQQAQQRERTMSDGAGIEPPQARVASPATSERLPPERHERLGRDGAKSSANRSRSADPKAFEKAKAIHRSSPSVKTHGTDSTDRTIKPTPLHERSPSAELTPDEHLDIGIQTHSDGQLNKSTYHLRLAAKAGLPTAMLLYALACRHGWGMRPNQAEGVMWLRKAIDSAGLEVADVEATLSSAAKDKNADPVTAASERRHRKAQFALAIYELGISYMNGWGCAKDKPLAVRCFEVAGSWGDCDALAEAGFCYTQGLGCKKDLKRAAALYRKAAEGGMSMAGNSW